MYIHIYIQKIFKGIVEDAKGALFINIKIYDKFIFIYEY
jgi:hypothetical protein